MEGYAYLASNLLKTRFLMFELTEIMRQKDDQTFAELLNRVREGNQTEDDIALLKSRSVSRNTERYMSLKDYQHLFPCNEDVDSHNDAVFDIYRFIRSNKRYMFENQEEGIGTI